MVPTAFAVTFPFCIVTTFSLLLLHTTLLSVALAGEITAESISISPTFNDNDDLLIEIDLIGTISTSVSFLVTITSHVAFAVPSIVETVITAFPALIAVTFPLSTVATLLSLLVHSTIVSDVM